MDHERWRRIQDLYQSALERQPDERGTYLDQACGGDEDLRHTVNALLTQSACSEDLVGDGVWEVVADLAKASNRLTTGARLGPYEVIGPLGEGGMGTVYRGLDTRLGRSVAIKVSAEHFSARFEREARAISALNHPNVCTLYDIGPNFLVMELVEGETLARRIGRIGPLSLQEVLDIGLQVADALQAAHRKGIVHRDLKPANVTITPEGRVKVLDFGLAKALGSDRTEQNVPAAMAGNALGSAAGQILGTPAYMSPEQAHGEDVNAQTDIWAFGCLLYELLTGERAFPGETSSEIVAAVLEREPDWQALPAGTPAKLRRLLRQCLEKDAARRLSDIGAARAVIGDVARRAQKATVGQWATVIMVVLAAALWAWLLRSREAQPDERILAVPLTTYVGSQDWPSFSPDGNEVAFSWDGEQEDNFDIYVKPVGPEPPRRRTNDPAADTNPVWSPDGRSIAFLRASRVGRLSVVVMPASGGPERILGEVARVELLNRCLAWAPDGKWLAVFDRPAMQAAGLFLLSTQTAERRRLTTGAAEGATVEKSPTFAPDGRSLAFARNVSRNAFDLYLLPLASDLSASGEPRLLARTNKVVGGMAWTGHGRELVFSSGPPGNINLFRMSVGAVARPKRLTQQGEILSLSIAPHSNRLVFVQSRREMDIYRADLAPNGYETRQSIPLIASSRLDRFPRYSPDGKRIAFVSLRSGDWQLWIADESGANAVQMTSFEHSEVAHPAWSPDSRQLAFVSNADGPCTRDIVRSSGRRRGRAGIESGPVRRRRGGRAWRTSTEGHEERVSQYVPARPLPGQPPTAPSGSSHCPRLGRPC
jgi:serine/threonine protein kinase